MKDALKQGNWFIHKSRTNCIFLQHSVILCCGNLFCQHLKRKLAAALNQRKSFSELLHFIIEQSHSFESIGWFGLWTQISFFLWPGRSKILFSKRDHSNWSKIGRSGWPESRSESDGFLAFVPRHKVGWSVGGAQCCFHLSFGNFNAMAACYHGRHLWASQKRNCEAYGRFILDDLYIVG